MMIVGCVGGVCWWSSCSAADEEIQKADLTAVQGVWERTLADGSGKVVGRATKNIQGDVETITYYDNAGSVLRAHRVKIAVLREGPVRVFQYREPEIVAGPGQGEKLPDVVGRYIYKVQGDVFVEIQGVLTDEEQRAATMLEWKRLPLKDA